MALPSFTNSGRVMYDVAITGIDPDTGAETPVPFLVGNSDDYPYLRESDGGVREQIDTTSEAGEQSLTGYWWRSQASFDLGSGVEYFDTAKDESVARRFRDSCGVHTFTPGKVTLLNATSNVEAFTDKSYITPYCLLDDDGQISEQGVLMVKSDFTGTPEAEILKVNAAGTATSLLDSIDAVYDLCTDGGFFYALKDDGIEKGLISGGSHLEIVPLPEAEGEGNVKRGRVAAVKDRLIVALSQETADADVSFGKIYEFATSYTGNLPDPIYTVEVPGWRWTGICEGPTAIYLGGYAGNTGRIYAITIDTSADPPTLQSPYTVAELPQGEVVTSIISYMATYLCIGTNKGVRIATINPDSSLTMGPLSVKSDTPVWGLCAVGDYVYAGGSSTTPLGETTRPGLWKINLGVDGTDPRSQLGIFPAARDLYAPDADNPGVNQILRVCPIGITGKIAFTVDNVGLYYEGSTEVSAGWLQTGRIRFDTQEKKAFDFLRINRDSSGIAVSPREEHDNAWGTLNAVTLLRTDGLSTEHEGVADRTARYNEVRYTFILTKGATAGAAFTGYQVRARPSNVVSRTIRLPLLCFPREKTRDGLDVERGTWKRIRALELMEKRGGYVRLQNLNTGEDELATFESIQFITTHTQQSRQDQANPGGMLLVTLRLVNV